MQRKLLGLAAALMVGACGSSPSGSGTSSQGPSGSTVGMPVPQSAPTWSAPTPQGLDGSWMLYTDIDPMDYYLNRACITITNGMVLEWFDACGLSNSLLVPAGIWYDGMGPAFDINMANIGWMTVYLTRLSSDFYEAEFDMPWGNWFGYMERL